MDYFSVIVLIIVTFIFISDRKPKTIDVLKKENKDIKKHINYMKENLKIIKLKTEDMDYLKIKRIIKDVESKYILIQNNKLKLTEEDKDTIIANYISSKDRACGFNLFYSYNEKKWSFRKLYLDLINYLNIFNKKDISTYSVIICKKQDFLADEKQFKQISISYTPTEFTSIKLTNKQIKEQNLKKKYIDTLKEANITIILKILLLIISGSIITTNLVYSILNIKNDIAGLIISLVIYYCYSYIIRYVYKPIGRQKIIASYIFPIYFIAYIFVSIYSLLSKVIRKVHAS